MSTRLKNHQKQHGEGSREGKSENCADQWHAGQRRGIDIQRYRRQQVRVLPATQKTPAHLAGSGFYRRASRIFVSLALPISVELYDIFCIITNRIVSLARRATVHLSVMAVNPNSLPFAQGKGSGLAVRDESRCHALTFLDMRTSVACSIQ
jgi:hypothetical protein